MKIFLATGNKHKIEEITAIFKNVKNIEILSIKDGIDIPEVVEDGDTFEANSAKKALEIAKYTGMITIADDSGLCVDALGGAPEYIQPDILENMQLMIPTIKNLLKNYKVKKTERLIS